MAESVSWRCPFCGQIATIRSGDRYSSTATLVIPNKVARCTFLFQFIVCPNDRCKKFTLEAMLRESRPVQFTGEEEFVGTSPIAAWQLIPASDAKVLPDYVPEAIVADYNEACAIKTLSPKASATLARRCLQGMIRDFWHVTKPKLVEEIKAIETKVDPQTWAAIDAVRQVGNIGAHMEADINVIVEVDPNEAGLLINLIETLVDEWYVTRHDRDQRMNKLIALGQAKRVQKQQPATPPPAKPTTTAGPQQAVT